MGKRVLVVANKTWEADPLVGAVLHEKASPLAKFSNMKFVNHPFLVASKPKTNPNPPPLPRITFTCGTLDVELWCLQDLMDPSVNGSSTVEKWRVLPRIFQWAPSGSGSAPAPAPDLTIAFGTAGFPLAGSNGGVSVGSRVFVHDPYAGKDRTCKWAPPVPDKTLDSTVDADLFRLMGDTPRFAAENRFISAPIAPARPPLILAQHSYVALSVVNVVDYDDYTWTDRSGFAAFTKNETRYAIGSVESTHGVIRSYLGTQPAAFLFVSGITDTRGRFDLEVTPRVYPQNFVAAHNAGVALAWLLPALDTFQPPSIRLRDC